jgi:hypothetical protein
MNTHILTDSYNKLSEKSIALIRTALSKVFVTKSKIPEFVTQEY